jgi:glucoamylase
MKISVRSLLSTATVRFLTLCSVLGTFVPSNSYAEDRFFAVYQTSFDHVMSNLNNSETNAGAVIASPSKSAPDYFYHWVRDAGLTMMVLSDMYAKGALPEPARSSVEARIIKWINYEERLQNKGDLGEPKFTVPGEIYPFGWGRPQTDGPAIRGLAMINFANSLLAQGRTAEARRLYAAELPARTPIKKDLEYVAHHWQDQSFDVWEEVKGEHFFTQMAQRAALITGATLADRLGDPGAASFYRRTAQSIEPALLSHRNHHKNYIVPTLNQTDGWRNRTSELDISVVLASLYFSLDDNFLGPNDTWIQRTAAKLEASFASIYDLNHNTSLAPAIGRYPEDEYDGVGISKGGPWILATNGFAEYYCRQPNRLGGSIVQNSVSRGFDFLARTLSHLGPNNSMTEQYNRRTGQPQGAMDLTWSYVSYLRAYAWCNAASH